MELAFAVWLGLVASPALALAITPFNGVWRCFPAASTGGASGQMLTISKDGNLETYLSECTDTKNARNLMASVAPHDRVPVPVHPYRITPNGVITAQPIMTIALDRLASADGRSPTSELTDFSATGEVTRRSQRRAGSNGGG